MVGCRSGNLPYGHFCPGNYSHFNSAGSLAFYFMGIFKLVALIHVNYAALTYFRLPSPLMLKGVTKINPKRFRKPGL